MRSFYLDDMTLVRGTKVVCKANMCAEWILIGKIYTVISALSIMADDGTIFNAPSARFQETENG